MRKTVITLMLLVCATAALAQVEESDDYIVFDKKQSEQKIEKPKKEQNLLQPKKQKEQISSKKRKNAFFIGPKVGCVMSTMTQPEQFDLYDSGGTDFFVGAALKWRLGKATEQSTAGSGTWALGAEFKYKLNTVKTIGTDESGQTNANLSLEYIEVPLYVQYYPLAKIRSMASLYLEVGTSLAYMISQGHDNISVNSGNGVWMIGLDAISGMDIRPLIGIGYTIPNTGLDINVRYNLGTSKLAENLACKISSFDISLSWMFKL